MTSMSNWTQDPELNLKGVLAIDQTLSGEPLTAPQSHLAPIGAVYANPSFGTLLDATQDLSLVTSVVNETQNNDLVMTKWPIDNAVVLDESLAALFIQSLAVTNGSVATALSTMITTLTQMAYYDQMPLFETSTNIIQVSFRAVVFPQSVRGLITVILIIAVHFILVLMIAVRFAKCSRYTTLGDHWQAVSQVLSPEIQGLVQNSSTSTDKQVRRHLKAEGKERVWVVVEPLEETNRLAIVCRDQTGRM